MNINQNKIRLCIGYDRKEAVAYHTFCQSLIDHSTMPLSITPLALHHLEGYEERHADGSNAFIYSRFLTPWLMGFEGWALFADGDMVCLDDISKLWALRDQSKAVLVVKHDYKTKAKAKYLGNTNQDYPRKNWSSVTLWNCGHPKNAGLIPEFVKSQSGAYLHRFTWLDDSDIGELPKEWNWLATEYEDNYDAKLVHYTLGTPCFRDYAESDMADVWHAYNSRANEGMGV